MVDEKEYWCGKCIKNKIFFAIFMSFPLDKLHRGGVRYSYIFILTKRRIVMKKLLAVLVAAGVAASAAFANVGMT